MRTILLALGLLLTPACGDRDDDDSAGDGSDACDLARENQACPECYSGEVTCSYGDTDATAGSCGDCQARSALYQQLCDDGIADSRADIEAGTTCSDPVNPEG